MSKIIPQKRQINAETDDRYFSFYELKSQLELIESFNEKIIFITEEIFNYQQADIISYNSNLQPFDAQCKQLIEQLQTMKALRAEFYDNKSNLTQSDEHQGHKKKIRINGPINILTNAYKQMMNSIKIEGMPYLPHKIKDIAQFICDNFVDENGNSLSISTIQTYLSPSRNDKDPNNDKSVKL